MCVSLHAHGPVKVEIGKYGLPLQDAASDFTETCVKLGLNVERENVYRGTVFRLSKDDFDDEKDFDMKLGTLIHQFAYVDNCKIKSPKTYVMYEEIVPPESYIKTGVYARSEDSI